MKKEDGILSEVQVEDIELLKYNPTEFWKDVTQIGDHAFQFCDELTNIAIPEFITKIGIAAFAGCTSLVDITIPSSVTTIGNNAFAKCTCLSSITVPKGITKIEYGTFQECSSLNSIIIPNSVTDIGYDAFKQCTSLTNFTIPESVTNIGDFAFMDCINLTDIYIPNTVKSIRSDILSGCDKITSIIIQSHLGKNLQASVSQLNKLGQDYLVAMQDEKSLKRFNTLSKHFSLEDDLSSYVKFFRMTKILGLLETDEVTLNKDNKDIPVADIAFEILQKGLKQGYINYNNLKIDLSNLPLDEFNIDFLEFLSKDKNNALEVFTQMNNFARISDWFKARAHLEIDEKTQLEGLIPTIEENRFKVWKYAQCKNGVFRNRWYAPTIKLILEELESHKFTGLTSKNIHIARLLAEHNYNQEQFNKAVEIDEERAKLVRDGKINNSIISTLVKESLVDSVEKYKRSIEEVEGDVIKNLAECTSKLVDEREYIFTYEMLDKSSEENFVMGNLTSCCAKLFASGAGAQRAMIVHPDMQPLVIRDVSGEIVAFSIVYVNREKGYAVMDDIEMSNKYDSKPIDIVRGIYNKAIEGLEKFIQIYNAENKTPITQVNTGVSPRPGNAISKIIIQNPKAETCLDAIDFNDYNYNNLGYWKPDWFGGQYVIWSADKEDIYAK